MQGYGLRLMDDVWHNAVFPLFLTTGTISQFMPSEMRWANFFFSSPKNSSYEQDWNDQEDKNASAHIKGFPLSPLGKIT